MIKQHVVQLVCNGTTQSIEIPPEFEFSTNSVVIRKEGDRLTIEPVKRMSLLELLVTLPTIEDEFPDVDMGLLPLDQVQF